MKKMVLVITLIIFTSALVVAQQFKMGKNLSNIKPGALFELEDSAKALILTRIAGPSIKIGSNAYRGMLVFDSSVNLLSYYDGSKWRYPLIDSSASQNIYNFDGTLNASRKVTMGGNYLRFLGNAGNTTLSLSSNGNVGIGTTDSIYRLNIKGGTTNSVGDINTRIIAINGAPVVYFDNNSSFAFGSTTAFKSLQSNTGIFNLAIGPGTLEKNTIGEKNVGLGVASLRSNTTGSSNMAIGALALYFNEIGSNNVAIGSDAMGGSNSSSSNLNNNVAIGSHALYNLTSNFNVGIGYKVLFYNKNGRNNVAVGTNAGNINSTGGDSYFGDYSDNILIGNNVRLVANQNNNTLNIGNVLTGIGVDSLSTNAKIGIGLGTNALPMSRLHVRGAVRADSLVLEKLPTSYKRINGLGIDSLGNVSIIAQLSSSNVFVQGIKNSGGNAFGDTARLGTYDSYPLRLYAGSLPGVTIKSSGILAGYAPIDTTTIYLRNIAYNASTPIALYPNAKAAGIQGVVVQSSTPNPPDVTYNLLDNNNTTDTKIYSSTSSGAICVGGCNAGFTIPLNALYYIDSVVLVSPGTGGSTVGLDIARVRITGGTSTYDQPLVGASGLAPYTPFGMKTGATLGNSVTIYFSANASFWYFNLSEVMIYGRRAKEIYSGSTETRINGTFAIDNLGAGGTLNVAANGVVSAASDSNLKISAGFLEGNVLSKMMQLKPRYYYWNGKNNMPMNIKELGFYAQEVNELLGNEAAPMPSNGMKYYGLNDRALIAYMVKAMQEQQTQIDENKKQIAELKAIVQQFLKK